MRKCIAILTCFMLLAGIVCVQLPLTTAAFTDVEDLPCKEEVELLTALGIVEGMSEETFAPEETLTRAEASAIICRLLGVADFVADEEKFSDVPFDHWAYDNIGTLSQLGIVNGVGDEVFAPEEALTYTQTVKLLVEALGYHVKAENAGGYPAGYMATASVLGILRGTAPNEDETISRGTMAIMTANALSCDMLVRTAYGDAYVFEEQENASILNTYLHVSKKKGRITATYDERLSGALRPETDEVVLDHSVIYKIGESNAAEYIGQNVTVYAKRAESDEAETILHVVPDSASVRYDFSASELRLEQKRIITEDDTKFILNDETVYVYNGRKSTDAFTLPTEGNVSLVCDQGNDVSTIFVSEYKSYVIKTALEDISTVYFKDVAEGETGELKIDTGDWTKVTRLLDAEGKAIAFSKLRADDVLTVMESKDQSALTVIRSDKTVKGTITEMQSDGKEVTIGEEAYAISASLYNNTNAVQPELNKESTFLLDAFGNIAAVAEEKERIQKYGYLLSASYTRGIDKRAQLKIYTEEGKMVVFDTADTIILKMGLSQIAKKTEMLLDEVGLMQLSGETLTVKEQLLMYETNAEGQLKFIELAIGDGTSIDKFSGDAKAEEQEKRNLSLSYDADLPTGQTYLGGLMRLYAGYVIPEDCVIFNLPAKVGDEPLPADEKMYSIISTKTLIHNGPELKNGGRMYDIEEDKTVGALVIQLVKEDTGTEMIDTAPVAIITEVVTRLNEDGDVGVGINAVTMEGKSVELFCPEDLEIEFGIKGDAKNTSTVIADINKETETEMENGTKVLKDYIRLTDLDPGDVIAYEELGGEIQKAAVRFRAEAPAIREFGTLNGKHAVLTNRDSFSVLAAYCGNVFWFNTIEEKTEDRMIVTFPVLRYEARYPDVTEWKRSEPWGTAKVYSFDMKTGKLEKSSADAIMEGSKVLYYRKNLVPTFIVIYKNMPAEIPPFAADLVPNK